MSTYRRYYVYGLAIIIEYCYNAYPEGEMKNWIQKLGAGLFLDCPSLSLFVKLQPVSLLGIGVLRSGGRHEP